MLKSTFKKISTQLLVSYTVPLICLGVLGLATFGSAQKTFRLKAERTLIQQSDRSANESIHQLNDATQKVKAYAIRSGSPHYKTEYAKSYQQHLRYADDLRQLAELAQDEQLLAIVQTLVSEGDRINKAAQSIIERTEANNASAANSLVFNLESPKVEEARLALKKHFTELLAANEASAQAAQQNLLRILLWGTAISVLFTIALGGIATYRLRRQIQKMVSVVEHNGIEVTTSSTQIAASSRQLEASVTEQAAATTQIAATAAEIAATAEELTQTMNRVMCQSESAAETAAEGKHGLSQMEATIRQLTVATSTISSKLGMIDEKANNISNVVGAINKVADQTNLLSLNAAIEAEKAGEYGAGFSVVAREIRRLADQTALATLEIERMVQEMLSSVSTGVMEMDRFTQEVSSNAAYIGQISEQVSLIISQVQNLAPQFETVSAGMSAQTQGAQQICSAMAQLNDTSQQTTESVKDTNQAISNLGSVALDLRSEVANFRVAV